MTREQKIKRAQELRAEGLTYPQIAGRLRVAKSTAFRWLNPEHAKRYLTASRAWKARNLDHVRASYREWYEANAGKCPNCHGPTSPGDVEMCRPCRQDERAERRADLAELWAAGATFKEIAAALDTTVNTVSVAMASMRADGWDLPYRRKGWTAETTERMRKKVAA